MPFATVATPAYVAIKVAEKLGCPAERHYPLEYPALRLRDWIGFLVALLDCRRWITEGIVRKAAELRFHDVSSKIPHMKQGHGD